MSISERVYYLKNGSLYKLTAGSLRQVDIDDILSDTEKHALLIDDAYFFYVGMDSVPVSGKKLRAVAENYLFSLFPADMVKSFGILQNNGMMLIYIISKELTDIIEEYPELFSSFKKISSPFFELCIKYNEFVFSDGAKLYKKSGNTVSMAQNGETRFIKAEDLFETMDGVKGAVSLPGIQKKSFAKIPLLMPAVVLLLCYIAFIISGLSENAAYKRISDYYNNALHTVYKNMNVASSKDPYGALIQKSRQVTGADAAEKTLSVLDNLKGAVIDGITLNNISIRDNDIRVEGAALNFTQVESLKKAMETKLQAAVNVDDTKKTKDGISFVMKYEKKH